MTLKQITFTFENCEQITIDGKYIGDFLVDNVETSLVRVACNAIEEFITANTFVIEIFKEANQVYESWNGNDHKCFDRLDKIRNITTIDLLFEKKNGNLGQETVRSYRLGWNEEDDCINLNQDSVISDFGNLYLAIVNDEDFHGIEDVVDLEEINDKDFIHFKRVMLDLDDPDKSMDNDTDNDTDNDQSV